MITTPGYQRTVSLNGHQLYLQREFSPTTEQELEPRRYLQGGPRTSIYYMGSRVVKGQFQVPFSISSDGSIDTGIKELLKAAQYPLSTNILNTNYLLSHSGITAIDNIGFGKYTRAAFEPFGITDLTLSVLNNGPVMLNVQFIAMVSATEAGVTPNPAVSSLMRRNLIYADCKVSLTNPQYHWDTANSIELNIKNEIPPIVVLKNYSSTTDQPEVLAMKSSDVWGTITSSVNRGSMYDEIDSLPSGGQIGENLIFDFGGLAIANFPHVIMKITNQKISGTEMIQRTTEFLTAFNTPSLTETEGLFITFP